MSLSNYEENQLKAFLKGQGLAATKTYPTWAAAQKAKLPAGSSVYIAELDSFYDVGADHRLLGRVYFDPE